MAEAGREPDGATSVTIFGRTYHLRGNEDDGYLQDLARLVDGRMREVATATGTADTLKVSILASLNIADEYLQARRGAPPREDPDAERRLANMISRLGEAVSESGGS